MENGAVVVALAALALVGLALAAVLVAQLRRAAVTAADPALAAAVGALQVEVQRALGATEQQVLTQTAATQRSLGEVARELGVVAERSAQVGTLARDIGSLSDLLRAPKPRGTFGELFLERVLADELPAAAFALQYGYRDGTRVDAVVRFGDRLVPIDAKFPLESFAAIGRATDDEDGRARRRAFAQQVKRHVDAVARYVQPGEGTIDYAFLYVPAENVFYECLARPDDDLDLAAYCSARRVIPASPNTLLAYLRVVSLGLRGLAIEESARDLQARVGQAATELGRLREIHRVASGHLDNAQRKLHEADAALARTALVIEGLGGHAGPGDADARGAADP